ncbi:hypothetical protein EC973_001293 [Apophysomyces ossiformis]|uniref:Alpha-methylacyl-CoA racemase n=1 Tax=Apophysomyces ossiformis TaxID=679940 RepID=A0A8H7ERZ0_9FUNG|nr:hypothetical protein EC973_001293 [Apophysomyces ossiformis]
MSSSLPLSGLVVFELAGLAPVPYAGMILADFGADVIRIDRTTAPSVDTLWRNKRSIALDLKHPAAVSTLKQLLKRADVFLDPFRPGVLEKMGLGPETLLAENPRLIIARLSGFGQKGPAARQAAHDVNYLAISGLLDATDFAGGGLMCVMGILVALIERAKSGKGQVVDTGLSTGTAYLATAPYTFLYTGLVPDHEPGTNMLDGGSHFYQVYETKDGRYMAVGAIEPQFYALMLKGIGLGDRDDLPDQHDKTHWPAMKEKLASIFITKTQAEWTKIFDGTDACVTPVLSFMEPIPGLENEKLTNTQWPRQASPPQPAPILSRTPARTVEFTKEAFMTQGKHTVDVLTEFGIQQGQIHNLLTSGAAYDESFKSRL